MQPLHILNYASLVSDSVKLSKYYAFDQTAPTKAGEKTYQSLVSKFQTNHAWLAHNDTAVTQGRYEFIRSNF